MSSVVVVRKKPVEGGNGSDAFATKPSTTTTSGSSIYASYDRRKEWQQCCAKAMGFEWVDHFYDTDDDPEIEDDDMEGCDEDDVHDPPPVQQVINLLDDDDDDDYGYDGDEQQHHPGREHHDNDNDVDIDPWMKNAYRIQADVNRMTNWIQRKRYEFVSVDMNDEEASLIQSTVTTFLAATATDLETLRNMILPSQSTSNINSKNSNTSSSAMNNITNDMASHRAGIVQILLEQLKEQLAGPFNQMQKQRTRVAVQLWQNPLQCRLYQRKKAKKVPFNTKTTADKSTQNVMQQMFDDDDEDYDDEVDENVARDQRFYPQGGRQVPPTTMTHKFGDNFLESFKISNSMGNNGVPRNRPEFVSELLENRHNLKKRRLMEQKQQDIEDDDEFNDGTNIDRPQVHHQQQQSPPLQAHKSPQLKMPYQQQHLHDENYELQRQEELRQEAMVLQMKVNSDLESVQKVEQTMVEITTLISQFSNLVSEQQDDIIQIHETAQTAKDNIQKGQENLVDATERTKRSKHYMAWMIFAMTVVLLFFHTIKY